MRLEDLPPPGIGIRGGSSLIGVISRGVRGGVGLGKGVVFCGDSLCLSAILSHCNLFIMMLLRSSVFC